jgi:pimeloyl-ACP methyl ester carboxylesterase
MIKHFISAIGVALLCALVPFGPAAGAERGFVEVSPGVDVFYREAGSGQTIVFVPGWTFASDIFEKQLEGLSGEFRVIAIDPRSQGRSTVTSSGNDYLTHAEDLAEFIDKKALKDIVLVGWSFGCLETYGYVKLRGVDNLKAHVCIDLSPKPLSINSKDWVEGPLDDIAEAYRLYTRDAKGRREFVTWYADNVMVERDLKPEEMAWIVDQSLTTPHWAAASLFASGMFANNLAEAKALDAATPTLNVVAKHWSETASAFVRQQMPKSQILVLGGHMMFWEHADAFNAALKTFIKSAD